MQQMKSVMTDIQSLGVRVPAGVSGRRGGAGPAEGRALVIEDYALHVPIASPFAARSPYAIQETSNGFLLKKGDHPVCPVEVVGEPAFYKERTETGIGYRQIALLHGRDCLATTVLQRCRHWASSNRCQFCGTEISLQNGLTLAKKQPDQLAEVALAAQIKDRVSHVVLTSGTGDPPGSEIHHLSACTAAIKKATGLPVHVQFAPPGDLGLLEILRDAGADTVGIHIESFDEGILSRIAAGKAAIGMARYISAWKRAVVLFGANQVSSFLIAGLGEDPESIVWGSEILADIGVYPFVVPLRPIPGSRLADWLPPEPAVMMAVYEKVAEVLGQKGLSRRQSKAGCVRCGACSVLPLYEKKAPEQLICRSTRNESETKRAFAIRQDVFVREQKLFTGSDRDENDPNSIHLVAEVDGAIVGTVRVFPAGSNGHWIGGRLAVRKKNRVYHVGAGLVREAMKRVKKRGCTHFTAHIQKDNVEFFKRLGWKPVGDMENHFNRPHQLMVADLGSVPDRDGGKWTSI